MSHPIRPLTADLDCMICCEPLTPENYVEYLPFPCEEFPTPEWGSCSYCETCLQYVLDTKFKIYDDRWKVADCEAEFRRLLESGPPVYMHDEKAFPSPGNTAVQRFWFMRDNSEKEGKVTGCLEGEARENYLNEKKAFFLAEQLEKVAAKEAATDT
jgi:hypothetical protein